MRRIASGVCSGGAGNRTPVPWPFRAGIYVCSLSILGVRLVGYTAFVGPDSDRQDPGTTIGQSVLTGTAAEADRVVSPTLRFPRARFASEPAPLGLSCRDGSRSRREGKLRSSSYSCDQLFTWPTDQPRHATEHFRRPVDTRSPPGHGNYTPPRGGKKFIPARVLRSRGD